MLIFWPADKKVKSNVTGGRRRRRRAGIPAPITVEHLAPKVRAISDVRKVAAQIRSGQVAIGKRIVAPRSEKKSSSFWDTLKKILAGGAKVAETILPLIGSAGPHTCRFTSHTGGTIRSGSLSLGASMVGLASPLNIAGSSHPIIEMVGSSYRFTHSGLLCPLEIPANTQKGDMIARIALNPMIEEWLSKMSNFEKYWFANIAVVYKPSCAATDTGTIVGFFEWDIDDPLSLGQAEDTVKDALAHESAEMTSVWSAASWLFSNADEPNERYFVDPAGAEPRLTTQGQFTICAGSDFTDAISAGQLEVAYTVHFAIPEVRSHTQGTWACYHGTGLGSASISCPLGTGLGMEPIHYPDPIMGDETVPQNTAVKTFSDGGSPADVRYQLPAGYWIVMFIARGTGFGGGINLNAAGSYIVLHDTAGTLSETAGSTVEAVGSYLLYSSGMETGRSPSDLPTNYFNITMGTLTTTSYARLVVAALNGLPSYVPPSALIKKNLELLQVQEKKMKQLEEYVRDKFAADGDDDNDTVVEIKTRRKVPTNKF